MGAHEVVIQRRAAVHSIRSDGKLGCVCPAAVEGYSFDPLPVGAKKKKVQNAVAVRVAPAKGNRWGLPHPLSEREGARLAGRNGRVPVISMRENPQAAYCEAN